MKTKTHLYLLVSTYLILIILILVMIKNNNFKNYGSLDIVMYDRNMEKSLGFTIEEFFAEKKSIDIILTGNKLRDAKLLDEFQSKVRSLVRSKDSIHCVHIKFCKGSKYEEFVKVIEICNVEKAPTFVPFGYDFWVTNPARKDFIMKHSSKIPK